MLVPLKAMGDDQSLVWCPDITYVLCPSIAVIRGHRVHILQFYEDTVSAYNSYMPTQCPHITVVCGHHVHILQ